MDACTSTCSAQSVGPAIGLVNSLVQTILAAQCAFSPPSMWPSDDGPKFIRDGNKRRYDFIIVGAGTAGCLLADRLSASGKDRVLLMEAGGDPPDEAEIPTFAPALGRTKYDWSFHSPSTRACLAYGGDCFVTRAKMLGGSGSHNYMIYLRGNDRDYDEWERLGNPGWNWRSALHYFKKSERNKVYPDGKYHSTHGKLIVDDFPRFDRFGDIIINGGVDSGYQRVRDFNGGPSQYLGYGYAQGTIHKCRRQSTLKNFLNSAAHRPNLDVVKYAMATNVEIDENNKAIGVRFIYNETNEYRAFCDKDVILSAGAIQSPQLLMLSGVGPRNQLRQFGIPVKLDSPGVGEKLMDHTTAELFFEFRSDGGNVTQEALKDFYNLAVHNRGPYCTLAFNVMGYINTVNGSDGEYPDIQMLHAYFKAGTANFAAYLAFLNMSDPAKTTLIKRNEKKDILVVIPLLLHARSTGTVRLSSSSIFDKPNIDLNILDDKRDTDILVEAIKWQVAQTKTKTYRKYGGKLVHVPVPECDNAYEYKSDAYWRCFLSYFSGTLYHVTGTCHMGPDTDQYSVVDHRLCVKGIRNLRVVDASIIPVIPSANTNPSVVMLAEKGAHMIKADWRRKSEY